LKGLTIAMISFIRSLPRGQARHAPLLMFRPRLRDGPPFDGMATLSTLGGRTAPRGGLTSWKGEGRPDFVRPCRKVPKIRAKSGAGDSGGAAERWFCGAAVAVVHEAVRSRNRPHFSA
jgi:hypothetical protein